MRTKDLILQEWMLIFTKIVPANYLTLSHEIRLEIMRKVNEEWEKFLKKHPAVSKKETTYFLGVRQVSYYPRKTFLRVVEKAHKKYLNF